MGISFNPGIRGQTWNRQEIQSRLRNLAAAQRYTWIRRDLSTSHTNCCISRFFWSIARHFHCVRSSCFDVDLAVSKRILSDLGMFIETNHADDQELILLFMQALDNFETRTHLHYPVLIQGAPLRGRTIFGLPAFARPPTVAGHQVPGTGNIDPSRFSFSENIPPVHPRPDFDFARRRTSVMPPPRPSIFDTSPVRRVSTFADPILSRVAPVPTVAGRQIPGTESVDLGRSRPPVVVVNQSPPVPTVAGHQIPGTGSVDLRSAARVVVVDPGNGDAGLGQFSRRASVVEPGVRLAPVPTVAGRQIPGSGNVDFGRSGTSFGDRAVVRPAPIPTFTGRQVPGTGSVDFGARTSFSADRSAALPAFTGGRVIPGQRG